jgi:hypothetical protein
VAERFAITPKRGKNHKAPKQDREIHGKFSVFSQSKAPRLGSIGKIMGSKIIFLGIARRALLRRLSERRDFRYTPDSANSTEGVVFKFDELFHFLAAQINAS